MANKRQPKRRKLTKKEAARMSELIEQGRKLSEAFFEGPKARGIFRTGARCTACKTGKVVGNEQFDYRGDPMNFIIGPGSRNQMTLTTTYYCDHCGLRYEFPPGQNPRGNPPAS